MSYCWPANQGHKDTQRCTTKRPVTNTWQVATYYAVDYVQVVSCVSGLKGRRGLSLAKQTSHPFFIRKSDFGHKLILASKLWCVSCELLKGMINIGYKAVFGVARPDFRALMCMLITTLCNAARECPRAESCMMRMRVRLAGWVSNK